MESPFRAIAEFTYDWESWISPTGELKWVNPAVERITGYTVSDCLEMEDYPLPLVLPADRPAVAGIMKQARGGQAGNHYEFRVLTKNHEIRWAAISWQAITVGGAPVGFRSSVRDIHKRKQMEAELQEAVRRAEAANHAKTEFLANVTHELRTPLQSVLGYAQLLSTAQLPEPLARYVATLTEQGKHLEQLVADLLDFSALQGGMLPLSTERYRPVDVVERVLSGLKPLAQDKGLALVQDTQANLSASGDPRRLAQVLTNLVGNAIKYTPQGEVRLTLALEEKDQCLVFRVDDTGPGLPGSVRLFEPFVQGRQDNRTVRSGVGLGLAISHKLCARMGGTLTATESPLGGAQLMARLPLLAPGSSSPIAHFEEHGQSEEANQNFARRFPLTVLVVDDVDAMRDFMGEALRLLGYEPLLASSADEAFSLVEARPVDLALVDIQMPEVDGWAAARGLRARFGTGPTLVALTAQSAADEPLRLREAGFDGFAHKPIHLGALQSLLARAHGERHKLTPSDSLFEEARWAEMAQLETKGGGTLLELMQARVTQALPKVLQRIQQSLRPQQGSNLRKALHDASGLFGLIGAQEAQRLAEVAEIEAELPGGAEEASKRVLAIGRRVLETLQTRRAMQAP